MSLPAGFLTIVLTDVEGSTAAWDADPEGTDRALQLHDKVLADAVAQGGGQVLKYKGEGDSTFSVFDDAAAAVAAAVGFLVELDRLAFPLRVRVGVHSGDLSPRDGDYFGPVPNRAARLRAMAEGNRVLLSATTAMAVAGRLPEQIELVDLGEHELRGLSRREHVHGVAHPDLAPVEPIGTPEAPPGNLPAPLDGFVGRDEERILLDKALRAHRLVTMVGPGGIGKSRLALQIAAEQTAEHPGGTWLVDVADAVDAESLARALAAIVGVSPPYADTLSAVADVLARSALVVLDTCEANVEAAAELAERLLSLQQSVVVLATSREPLGARGEAVLRIAPMTLDNGARELFLTRAAAADLAASEDIDDALVERVCAVTDGIPLALELVAARLAFGSVGGLAASLDDLTLLVGPDAARRRTGHERHRSLTDTIRWSIDALSEDERRVLVELTVFAGGWPYGAADAIGAPAATVAALVRRSLVVPDRSHPDRLRLLDTVRETVQHEYGAPQPATKDRHLAWATERAEEIERLPFGDRRDAFGAERNNLRRAFEHALAVGDAAGAHRLVYAQANSWAATRDLAEARAAAASALSLGESPHRGAALAAAGFLEAISGEFDEAQRLYRECSERAELDPEIRSDVLNGLVMMAAAQHQPADDLLDTARRAVDAAREVPHSNALAVALNNLAVVLSQNHAHVLDVLAVVREGADIERRLDGGAAARLNLAVLLIDALELDEADRILDEIRAACSDPRNLGVWWSCAISIAAERARVEDVADGVGELVALLDNGSVVLDDDHLAPIARVAAEWDLPYDAQRLLSHLHEGDDPPTRAWLELRAGKADDADTTLGPFDPEQSTWWFCAIAGEIATARGHDDRVPGIVHAALDASVSRGQLRAARRLRRLLESSQPVASPPA